ncbi:uncharacterized protein PgNI_02462 [Pyricularia grisea]|uniref:Uncharacterized protein n=1 Tax=Pyricularia grisea TaxID=148305 RepID=A0A6P8BMZ0_PYRGI|nr:uncharacterized protein PgNI_02462 [Pyricularia grisea]TLD17812.1 hypothetical protein PgNI_02462 [Pyricularia grisea]
MSRSCCIRNEIYTAGSKIQGAAQALQTLSSQKNGTKQVSSAVVTFVGVDKAFDPLRPGEGYVSPGKRTVQTLELLLSPMGGVKGQCEVTVTKDIVKWDYGRYQNLEAEEIRSLKRPKYRAMVEYLGVDMRAGSIPLVLVLLTCQMLALSHYDTHKCKKEIIKRLGRSFV